MSTPTVCPDAFEARRQAIFDRLAAAALEQLDPAHHLVPARPLTTGLHSQAAGFGIRDSANALVALAMTGHEQRAWRVLERILEHQDTDPASFTRGNFRWYSGWTHVRDPNAASFMVPKLCYVLRHRGERMPPALRGRLEDALRLAVDGLNAHRCAWEYTNIWLLNTASKLMIADVLDDPRARHVGYFDWEEWRNWTARLGAIPEANCPGYTFVHIDAMALMLTCRLDAGFLGEVRATLRHHISSVVLDYHERIGVVTGPKSRGSITRRGSAGLDTVLHFVLDAPEPTAGCHLWLGAPIGPEDVLPIARDCSLPRQTHSRSHGYRRFNYLDTDFALGGVDGKGGFSPQRVPFFIAHRTSAPRCTVPVEVPGDKAAEAYFTDQDKGTLLAAGIWLVPDDGQGRDVPAHARPELQNAWLSRLTGLNCGRPDNLLWEGQPQFDLALGDLEQVALFAPGQGEVSVARGQSVALETTTLVLSLERVRIGLRWFTHVDGPRLVLSCQEDGEVRLEVAGSRDDGLNLNASERAVMLGMLVDVTSMERSVDASDYAAHLAAMPLSINATSAQASNRCGWVIEAKPHAHGELTVRACAENCWLYGLDQQRVSTNQWARSLSHAGREAACV